MGDKVLSTVGIENMMNAADSCDDDNEQPVSLDEHLGKLVDKGSWQSVVRLGQHYERCERSRYLWAWPSLRGIDELGGLLSRNDCRRVLSIGCGAGLLEWLLMQQCPDIRVFGLDLDQSWWTSAYAPTVRNLVPRTFVSANEVVTSRLLQKAVAADDSARGDVDGFALLFCYFNDRTAFDAYVNAFEGRFVVVIGPLANDGIVTDPRPLDVLQQKDLSAISVRNGWQLGGCVRLDDDGGNVAVLYVKREIKI